ncbi:MAG: DUF4238 domain-containing protein [Desulfarculus sp.]|nr:DUF4238 domain-containing protein [Desulfarculus sp.]
MSIDGKDCETILYSYIEVLSERVKTTPAQPDKRRHHFIPKFYLSNFINTQTNRLFVVNKFTGQVFEQTPRSTGFENDFYTVGDRGTGDFHTLLEELWEKTETDSAPIMRKLVEGIDISTHERAIFSFFVATLIARSRSSIHDSEHAAESILAERMKFVASDAERFDRIFGDIPEPPKELATSTRDFFLSGKCKHKANRNFSGPLAASLAVHIAFYLVNMNWHVGRTNMCLICSDTPAVVCSKTYNGMERFRGGIGLSDSELTLPLNTSLALLANHNKHDYSINHIIMEPSYVKKLNENTAISAENFIYASLCNEQLLSFIKKRKGIKICTQSHTIPAGNKGQYIFQTKAARREKDKL